MRLIIPDLSEPLLSPRRIRHIVILLVLLAVTIALYAWSLTWGPSCLWKAQQYDPTGELCDFT